MSRNFKKINGTSESLVERLIDFKKFALSVLGYLGSISSPDGATLKEEAHALQCTTAGPYNAIPTDLQRTGSVCDLGIDQFRIRNLSLAALFRTAANSNTLAGGLAKISAAREYDGVSFFSRWITAPWKPLNTRVIWIMLAELPTPSDKKQKAATALLRDAI